MPTQAPASDSPLYGIFLSHKKSLFSKMGDGVIACVLRFGLPQLKILDTLMHFVNVFS